MSAVLFCNAGNLKKFAKVIARRFGIQLTRAQEILCRAGGYQGWHQFQKAIGMGATEGVEHVPLVDWGNSLRQALGADMDKLLSPDEVVVWWRRLCVRKGVEQDVLGEVAAVFGPEAAQRYLLTRNFALGGLRPVGLLATPQGVAVVLDELHCQQEGGPL